LEELKKGEDELKEKEKAARLALIAEQKLKTKEEEDARKRNAFRRQKEMDEKRAEELRQREQRRNTIESQEFHSIEDAIERMRTMYELTRFVQFGKLLIKILKNILASTENENFRTLRLQNYNIQEHLVRPLSGVYILKSLGFIEQTRNINANENDMHDIDEVKKADTLYLAKDKINPTAIQHVLSLLDNSLSSYSTTVAAVFDQLTPKYSLETLSFIAKELLIILQNVVSAPTERNFCSIDCESDSYQTFLQPYPEIMDLVKSFGFEHHTSKIYWICENPNVTQCEAGIIDLQQEIFKRQKYTPVCIATTALLQENTQPKQFAIIKKFVSLIKTALERIINDPHEQKYHNIRIDKLIVKCGGPVKGAIKFLSNFGFEIKKLDTETDTASPKESNGIVNGEAKRMKHILATLPYPGYNLELLKVRFNEFSTILKESIPNED
jgi:hypothetical protein